MSFSVWAHNADYAIVKGSDGVYTIINKETGSVVKVANYERFETLDQAKRFATRNQIEADVDLARTVWRPPKRWNGPGAEKGEWLGSRGNSGWVDNRPEVQKIVKGEPIPFVEGRVNFDKWAKEEFRVPGVQGGRANRNADTKLMYKHIFEKEKLGAPGQVYSRAKHESVVTDWLNKQDNGFGGKGLRPHHAGGERVQYVPSDLHGVQHTDVEAFIPVP